MYNFHSPDHFTDIFTFHFNHLKNKNENCHYHYITFEALRNPSSAVGLVQHLDAEHFSKWALYACEEDPEILYQDPSIPPGFHVRVCTQVKITGRLSFLEHFRNDSVTSLALPK